MKLTRFDIVMTHENLDPRLRLNSFNFLIEGRYPLDFQHMIDEGCAKFNACDGNKIDTFICVCMLFSRCCGNRDGFIFQLCFLFLWDACIHLRIL